MGEDKATVKKAGASETSPVTDAETETSPKGGGGEAPETVDSDARERGLDDSGTKKELAARINEHDEQGAHKPEVLFPVAKD
jgi:hypothetical protein